jgi:hypothetical protein
MWLLPRGLSGGDVKLTAPLQLLSTATTTTTTTTTTTNNNNNNSNSSNPQSGFS